MAEYRFAENNGRAIPKEDKMFRINGLCKAAQARGEKVIAATLGTIADDQGKQVAFKTIVDLMRNLDPLEYMEYPPLCGTPKFREAAIHFAFGGHEPKDRTLCSVVTPGGSGALGTAMSVYTKLNDHVLVSDWHWSTYRTIAMEHVRDVDTYRLFNEEGHLDAESLEKETMRLAEKQGSVLVILNTPAQNPTGYSFTGEDWDKTLAAFKKVAAKGHRVVILVDMAYIDFAGDYDEVRFFMDKMNGLPENIIPLFAFSTSKSFAMYGCRCGALIVCAPDAESADEFRMVAEYSMRGAWSCCAMAPMKVIEKLYENKDLYNQVVEEREKYRALLADRGHTFEKAAAECGLEIVPFDSGYFVSMPYPNPDALIDQCIKHNLYLIPTTLGVRASVAAVTKEECAKIPAIVKQAIEELK